MRVLTTPTSDRTPLCTQARYFANGGTPDCQVVTAGGRQVAVATLRPGGTDTGFGLQQWVVYEQPDGTAVMVGQGRQAVEAARPLPALPYTTAQLIALATDPDLLG